MIIATPLGVSAAVPMHGRHLSGVLLDCRNGFYLADCGEATQFQLGRTNWKQSKLRAVFISHLHGDHYFGLFGLLSTLTLLKRQAPLTIVGPVGLKSRVDVTLDLATLQFELTWLELDPQSLARAAGPTTVYENEDLTVTTCALDHTLDSLGFRFTEKPRRGRFDVARAQALGITNERDYGRLTDGEPVTSPSGLRVEPADVLGPERPGSSFAYITDTRPCPAAIALADHADVLYHEATFQEAHKENAVATGHSTAREAASVAKNANAKQLVLTHFSARYDNLTDLVKEAAEVFPNTSAAQELQPVRIGRDEK